MARETLQKFTLIRFSRAAAAAVQSDVETAVDRLADLNAEIVDARFDQLLEERRRQLEVTQLAVGPREALELVNQLLRETPDETNVVYLLSDFRENQWSRPAELRRALRETEQFSEAIHLVRCSRQRQANLAVAELNVGDETRAAGVPFFVQVSVRNFGTEAARRVPVRVRATSFDPEVAASAEPGTLPGKSEEPPALLLEEVPPGETVVRRVQLFFAQPGPHIVEALLPEDAVAADNHRWCVVDLPAGEPVLIVDGSLNQRHAYFLAAAFQPGQRAKSGVRPDIQPVSALRDTPPDSLAAYRAIYLLDVDRLDDRARENLEAYVQAGGGLAVFAGEHVDLSHYTQQLYREGQGFFPLPLRRADQLPVETFDNTPDFRVESHPVFRIFTGDQSRFLSLVTIDRYLRPPDDWRPDPQSTVPRPGNAPQPPTARRRTAVRTGPRRGVPEHTRARLEQLGARSQLCRHRAATAVLSGVGKPAGSESDGRLADRTELGYAKIPRASGVREARPRAGPAGCDRATGRARHRTRCGRRPAWADPATVRPAPTRGAAVCTKPGPRRWKARTTCGDLLSTWSRRKETWRSRPARPCGIACSRFA